MTSNPELRAELTRVTTPPDGAGPDWLERQIRKMEALKLRLPHSICLQTRCTQALSELNCFMFAFDIEPNAVRAVGSMEVFPGKSFTRFLVSELLIEQEIPIDGNIAIYFSDDGPTHAGKYQAGRMVSKWGSGGTHIWSHPIWEVPEEYGDEIKFFAGLLAADQHFREWAASHGP